MQRLVSALEQRSPARFGPHHPTSGRQHLHARAALLVAPRLASCIASDNSRVAERALSVFSSEGARAVLLTDVRTSAPLLLPALLRGFVPHWNQTVNKMTHEVLTLMRTADASHAEGIRVPM